MENCTVFWMKVDGWIRSEAVNINTKAVYFHAVTLRTFNFRPVSKKMTNRQVVKEYLIGYILCSLRSAVLDWGSFSSRLLKSTSFSEAHFEIHKMKLKQTEKKFVRDLIMGG